MKKMRKNALRETFVIREDAPDKLSVTIVLDIDVPDPSMFDDARSIEEAAETLKHWIKMRQVDVQKLHRMSSAEQIDVDVKR